MLQNRNGVVYKANKTVTKAGKQLGMSKSQIKAAKATCGQFVYDVALNVTTTQINNAFERVGERAGERKAAKLNQKIMVQNAKAEANAIAIKAKAEAEATKKQADAIAYATKKQTKAAKPGLLGGLFSK